MASFRLSHRRSLSLLSLRRSVETEITITSISTIVTTQVVRAGPRRVRAWMAGGAPRTVAAADRAAQRELVALLLMLLSRRVWLCGRSTRTVDHVASVSAQYVRGCCRLCRRCSRSGGGARSSGWSFHVLEESDHRGYLPPRWLRCFRQWRSWRCSGSFAPPAHATARPVDIQLARAVLTVEEKGRRQGDGGTVRLYGTPLCSISKMETWMEQRICDNF